MKKAICLVAALAMICTLAACGSGSNTTQPTETGSAEQTVTQAAETTENETTVKETETTAEETTEEETTTAKLEKEFSATIEETVMVDEMGVKITATELSYNSYQAQLSVTIENNTDKKLTFLSGTMGYPITFVNGYMVTGGYLNEDVAAGMTANETINFSLDELLLFGMKDVAEIGIGFEIKDGYEEYLKTKPAVVKTSADAGYDYSADTFAEAMKNGAVMTLYGASIEYSSDEVIFDESGVSITNQYVATNKDGDTLMFMEVKNDTDRDIYAAVSDIKLDGIIISSGTWDADYIAAGKRAVMSIDMENVLETEYMEALGIADNGNLGFHFEALEDDYDTEIGETDISINSGNTAASEFSGEAIYSENNITIMYAGLIEDPSDYSNDWHALLVIRNENDFEISIDDEDGAYVDKMKIDFTCYSVDVQPGEMALIDVELDGDDLDDNNLDIDAISEISVTFEIRDDDYKVMDQPAVTMSVSH